MALSRRSLSIMAVVLIVVAIVDQITKLMVVSNIALGERIQVVPNFFNLTLTFNPGAAFGFLANVENDVARHVLLSFFTLLALLVVFYFLIFDYYKDSVAQASLAMILGGAIGNIIDRVRFGSVVDFLDFYISQYHWPVFNIADSAICVGVAILAFRRPARADGEEAAKQEVESRDAA